MNKKIIILSFIILVISVSIITTYIYRPFRKYAIIPPNISDPWVYTIYLYPQQKYRAVNIPIRLYLNTENFGFRTYYEDGSDIRFYDINGQLLQHNIIHFSRTEKIGIVDVLIPELPPKDEGIVAIFLGCGVARNDASTESIYIQYINHEFSVWEPSGNVIILLDKGYEGSKCNKIVIQEAYSYSVLSSLSFGSSTKISVSFLLKMRQEQTWDYGGKTAFNIDFYKNNRYYISIHIDKFGHIGFSPLTSDIVTYSTVNILKDTWYIFKVNIDFLNNKWMLLVYNVYGNKILEVTENGAISSSSYVVENGLLCTLFDKSGYNPQGIVWFDALAISPYLHPPIVTIIEEPPPSYQLTVLTGMTYPSATAGQKAEVLLQYGSNPVSGESVVMTIKPKGNYIGFQNSSVTDTNGKAVFIFPSPPYRDPVTREILSPYDVEFSVPSKNITKTVTMAVIPPLDIRFIDLKSVQYYNLENEFDLYLEFKVQEKETGTEIIAINTEVDVQIDNIPSSYISTWLSPNDGTVKVQGKIHAYYQDTLTRLLNITINVRSLTDEYYPAHKFLQVQMKKPVMNIIIRLPLEITVGTTGFYIVFEDTSGQPYEFSPEVVSNINQYIVISIKTPEGTELLNTNGDFKVTYLESANEHKVFVDYSFNTEGSYTIVVKTEGLQEDTYTTRTVTVRSSMFPTWMSNPYIWLGILVLIGIIVLLFSSKKKKEMIESW